MPTQTVQQGWNQSTAAQQSLMAWGLGQTRTPGRSPRKRRKSALARGARRVKRARASGKRVARLVKGSAAAKRYMASIRKKRRR